MRNWGSPVTYPTSSDPFPSRLAGLAAMIAGGLPLRLRHGQRAGDVRHARRPGDGLGSALALTAASLKAFQRDLEARGLSDRVIVHVWSEFGRRGEENGSLGTDHGAAGMGFLIGSQVKGQMLGEFPGLASGLDDEGNLKATLDYRSLLLLAPRTVVLDRRGGDHPECGKLRPPFAPEVGSLRRHLVFVALGLLVSAGTLPLLPLARSDGGGSVLPDARPGRRGRVSLFPLSLESSRRTGDDRARELRGGRPQFQAQTRRGHARLHDRQNPARSADDEDAPAPARTLQVLVQRRRPQGTRHEGQAPSYAPLAG